MTAPIMSSAANTMLALRDRHQAAGDLSDAAGLEIDAIAAVRKLLADHSPRLRHGLLSAALEYAAPV